MFLSQGRTLIFSYIRRLGSFFGVQNFEFQNCLGFSVKRIFLGYEDLVDIFWGLHFGLYLGVISMHFSFFFLKVKVKNGGYFFWVAKISNIFWGA